MTNLIAAYRKAVEHGKVKKPDRNAIRRAHRYFAKWDDGYFDGKWRADVLADAIALADDPDGRPTLIAERAAEIEKLIEQL